MAIVALIATPLFVTESRRSGNGSFDLTGAVLGTAGLLALVYGVIRTDAAGWGSAEVLGSSARRSSCWARSSSSSRARPTRWCRCGSSASAG